MTRRSASPRWRSPARSCSPPAAARARRGTSTAPPPAPPPPARRGPASVVATKTTSLGTFLVDAKGRALYLWDADHGAKSACSGACAQAWPPLTSATTPEGERCGQGLAARHDEARRRLARGHLRRAPALLLRRRQHARPDHRPGQRQLRLAVVGRLAGRQGDPELDGWRHSRGPRLCSIAASRRPSPRSGPQRRGDVAPVAARVVAGQGERGERAHRVGPRREHAHRRGRGGASGACACSGRGCARARRSAARAPRRSRAARGGRPRPPGRTACASRRRAGAGRSRPRRSRRRRPGRTTRSRARPRRARAARPTAPSRPCASRSPRLCTVKRRCRKSAPTSAVAGVGKRHALGWPRPSGRSRRAPAAAARGRASSSASRSAAVAPGRSSESSLSSSA